jgi:hypothetical protein
MGDSFINLSRFAWLIGVALLVMIANMAASVLYMVVYSYVIEPGHDPQYYADHIQVAAPYCSILAGMPLMFLAGWWAGRWRHGVSASRSALVIWLVYAVIDVAIMVAAGLTSTMAVLVFISLATKLAAVWVGAQSAGRRGVLHR